MLGQGGPKEKKIIGQLWREAKEKEKIKKGGGNKKHVDLLSKRKR